MDHFVANSNTAHFTISSDRILHHQHRMDRIGTTSYSAGFTTGSDSILHIRFVANSNTALHHQQ
jgi:hypothetical protein